jgi:hypothetical protein
VITIALGAMPNAIELPGRHALSLNTIYAHLRRIKDKTGCRKVPELIRRLNDLTLPSRSFRP